MQFCSICSAVEFRAYIRAQCSALCEVGCGLQNGHKLVCVDIFAVDRYRAQFGRRYGDVRVESYGHAARRRAYRNAYAVCVFRFGNRYAAGHGCELKPDIETVFRHVEQLYYVEPISYGSRFNRIDKTERALGQLEARDVFDRGDQRVKLVCLCAQFYVAEFRIHRAVRVLYGRHNAVAVYGKLRTKPVGSFEIDYAVYADVEIDGSFILARDDVYGRRAGHGQRVGGHEPEQLGYKVEHPVETFIVRSDGGERHAVERFCAERDTRLSERHVAFDADERHFFVVYVQLGVDCHCACAFAESEGQMYARRTVVDRNGTAAEYCGKRIGSQ